VSAEDRLVKMAEAQFILGMSRQTFYEFRRKGFFPPVVLGPNTLRWRLSDLQRWVKEGFGRPETRVLAARTQKQVAASTLPPAQRKKAEASA
jgi:predicted DNA-binding transcriptional regulator AlpA